MKSCDQFLSDDWSFYLAERFFFFFCLADRQPSKKIQRSLIQPRYISVRTIRYTIVFTDYSPVYMLNIGSLVTIRSCSLGKI